MTVSPIDVSAQALEKLKCFTSKRTCRAIRFGVSGGGCSGYRYVISYDDQCRNDYRDIEWEIDDIKFVIDKKSVLFLTGSKLTWKNTLMSSGFEFENPQEISKCGCGHSFNAK